MSNLYNISSYEKKNNNIQETSNGIFLFFVLSFPLFYIIMTFTLENQQWLVASQCIANGQVLLFTFTNL